MNFLIKKAFKAMETRAPDFIIGGAKDPYLLRWFVIPRNPFFNVYAHEFRRSDDDRALHDHPWLFNMSVLLGGSYLEHTPIGVYLRMEGMRKFRWGCAPHRVELINRQPVRTLFITGPKLWRWGFYCPHGWVHWKKFTAVGRPGEIGKGCGE